MSRACLDNHVLIWGIRGVATAGQESMIERARALFEELEREETTVLLPTVVLSEFLAAVPQLQHAELVTVLRRRFELAPFDVRAAALAAGLWRKYAERQPSLRAVLESEFPDVKRVKVRADVQILATAISRKTDFIYTHDAVLERMAEGLIEVRKLPPAPPVQKEMFGG